MTLQVETHLLKDDGVIPNNDRLPLVIYRSAVPDVGSADECVRFFQGVFATHGWGHGWVNGIYSFHHYHATCHEVLGVAAGAAEVQFGGPSGPVLALETGDAVTIPAGVGHCRRDRRAGLVVVGAYPKGQDDVDLRRATASDRAIALGFIPQVALPSLDPIAGAGQGLPLLWQ